MSHWIHPEAEAELGDAAVYYATHASLLIAEAFLAEYERVLELLCENQQRGPHGGSDMRIYHFDRFPYTVIYAEDADLGPQIFAIAHQSRERSIGPPGVDPARHRTACEFSHGESRALPTSRRRAVASLKAIAFQGA